MAPQPPTGRSYSDVDALSAQIGIGGREPRTPRRGPRIPGTAGNPILIAAATTVFAVSAAFLLVSLADAVRGRSSVAAAFHHGPDRAAERRAAIAKIRRDFATPGFEQDIARLWGFVPPRGRIVALSINSEPRLSALAVVDADPVIYDANGRDSAPYPWMSSQRAEQAGVTLASFDPRAPARIVTAVTALPGFPEDEMSSLTLERTPASHGELRWTATWGAEHAVFSAALDGRHVRREADLPGTTS